MKSSKEFAAKWNVAERTVVNLCKNGKIPGAQKSGKKWQIPDDAIRPEDGRVKSGKYIRKNPTKHNQFANKDIKSPGNVKLNPNEDKTFFRDNSLPSYESAEICNGNNNTYHEATVRYDSSSYPYH